MRAPFPPLPPQGASVCKPCGLDAPSTLLNKVEGLWFPWSSGLAVACRDLLSSCRPRGFGVPRKTYSIDQPYAFGTP